MIYFHNKFLTPLALFLLAAATAPGQSYSVGKGKDKGKGKHSIQQQHRRTASTATATATGAVLGGALGGGGEGKGIARRPIGLLGPGAESDDVHEEVMKRLFEQDNENNDNNNINKDDTTATTSSAIAASTAAAAANEIDLDSLLRSLMLNLGEGEGNSDDDGNETKTTTTQSRLPRKQQQDAEEEEEATDYIAIMRKGTAKGTIEAVVKEAQKIADSLRATATITTTQSTTATNGVGVVEFELGLRFVCDAVLHRSMSGFVFRMLPYKITTKTKTMTMTTTKDNINNNNNNEGGTITEGSDSDVDSYRYRSQFGAAVSSMAASLHGRVGAMEGVRYLRKSKPVPMESAFASALSASPAFTSTFTSALGRGPATTTDETTAASAGTSNNGTVGFGSGSNVSEIYLRGGVGSRSSNGSGMESRRRLGGEKPIEDLPSPPDHLDRLDQADLPLDGAYDPVYTGAGVDIYVLDSGCDTSHEEFGTIAPGGQLREVENVYPSGASSDNDVYGHGSLTASLVSGSNVGVAPGSNLYCVKVVNNKGVGTTTKIVQGIEFVLDRVVGEGNSRLSVVSMSLAGECDSLPFCSSRSVYTEPVESLINNNIVVVSAAGNSYCDTCHFEPAASSSGVIAVGATMISGASETDYQSYYTNHGECNDIFATGSSVWAACNYEGCGSYGLYKKYTGTSISTPIVAGLSALWIEAYLAEGLPYTPQSVQHMLSCTAARERMAPELGPGSLLFPTRNLLAQSPPGTNPFASDGLCDLGLSEVAGVSCPGDCSGNGYCGSDGVCLCDMDWFGDECSLPFEEICNGEGLNLNLAQLIKKGGATDGWGAGGQVEIYRLDVSPRALVATIEHPCGSLGAEHLCLPDGQYRAVMHDGDSSTTSKWYFLDLENVKKAPWITDVEIVGGTFTETRNEAILSTGYYTLPSSPNGAPVAVLFCSGGDGDDNEEEDLSVYLPLCPDPDNSVVVGVTVEDKFGDGWGDGGQIRLYQVPRSEAGTVQSVFDWTTLHDLPTANAQLLFDGTMDPIDRCSLAVFCLPKTTTTNNGDEEELVYTVSAGNVLDAAENEDIAFTVRGAGDTGTGSSDTGGISGTGGERVTFTVSSAGGGNNGDGEVVESFVPDLDLAVSCIYPPANDDPGQDCEIRWGVTNSLGYTITVGKGDNNKATVYEYSGGGSGSGGGSDEVLESLGVNTKFSAGYKSLMFTSKYQCMLGDRRVEWEVAYGGATSTASIDPSTAGLFPACDTLVYPEVNCVDHNEGTGSCRVEWDVINAMPGAVSIERGDNNELFIADYPWANRQEYPGEVQPIEFGPGRTEKAMETDCFTDKIVRWNVVYRGVRATAEVTPAHLDSGKYPSCAGR